MDAIESTKAVPCGGIAQLPVTARFEPCAIVPVYNHGEFVGAVIDALIAHRLPVIVVDDGSDRACAERLQSIAKKNPAVTLMRLKVNQGKGAAVIAGLRRALAHGYTHAFQIDADHQHDLDSIPHALSKARQYPDTLIAGCGRFEGNMPVIRRYGRWFTYVFVWINTWSVAIRDAFCGFRIYPVAATVALADRVSLDPRMGFDIEVAVRLLWWGMPVRSYPVRVRYPDNGISHFRMVWDNVWITGLHTRLFVGMLWRSPMLLQRKIVARLRPR